MSFLSFLPLVGQVLGGVLGNRSQRRAEASNRASADAAAVRADIADERSRQAATLAYERDVALQDDRQADNDRRSQIMRDETIADRANMFSDLRASAVQGGFNPLTALTATGGGGFGSGSSAPSLSLRGAPVASPVMSYRDNRGADVTQPIDYSWMSSVGQGLQDIATNRLGYEMADRQLGLDLQKAQIRVLDRQASQPLALGSQRTSSVSNVRGAGGVGVSSVITPVIQPHITTSGNQVNVPVGPDVDEVVSGFLINTYGAAKDYYGDSVKPNLDAVGGALNIASEYSRQLDAKFWSLFNSNVRESPSRQTITPNPHFSN